MNTCQRDENDGKYIIKKEIKNKNNILKQNYKFEYNYKNIINNLAAKYF
jgi:hypothetical protein